MEREDAFVEAGEYIGWSSASAIGCLREQAFVYEYRQSAGGDQGPPDQGCPQRHLSHG